jgi:hypothetical protein
VTGSAKAGAAFAHDDGRQGRARRLCLSLKALN